MENDRTYYEAGEEQRLQYSADMGPRRETEKSKSKCDMETNGGEGKGGSRLEILERSADSSSGPEEVEKLCEGLMCHDAKIQRSLFLSRIPIFW